jgi:signal transduction histidine kinase
MIDRVFFVEERERISIQAAEDERARLSRELHDDPLQALAGVILQLEHRPEIHAERKTLRDVAAQLRGVATQLHPPVLDDLGLVPAIQSLFAEPGPVEVSVEIENDAGYGRSQRPPADVELAAYRIIAEATGNAIRHSGCQRVIVRGRVGPLDLTIDVVDDGHGVRPREIEDAMRAGHLGVASMRRRAEAIDARLAHESHPERGTVVSLRWTA